MKIMSADEWKHELDQKIAEEKKTEADWKLLTKAQQFEKTNIKKAIAIYEGFVSELAHYLSRIFGCPSSIEKKKTIKMKFVCCRPLYLCLPVIMMRETILMRPKDWIRHGHC